MMEDRRRLAWSRHPTGVLVVSALRMIAMAILATARRLSKMGYSLEIPSWAQVAEHFLMLLCGGTLDTEALRPSTPPDSARPGAGLLLQGCQLPSWRETLPLCPR